MSDNKASTTQDEQRFPAVASVCAFTVVLFANGCCKGHVQLTPWPCPVNERLAKQKFPHWGFPVSSNEAEIFFA